LSRFLIPNSSFLLFFLSAIFRAFDVVPRGNHAREDRRMAAAMQLDSTEPQHAMLITIEKLRRWFDEDSATLVNRLQEETGRYARSFSAVIYRDGTEISRCAIRHGSAGGFGTSITY
jgi:hypothetical protein